MYCVVVCCCFVLYRCFDFCVFVIVVVVVVVSVCLLIFALF